MREHDWFYAFLENVNVSADGSYFLRFDIFPERQLNAIVNNTNNIGTLNVLDEISSSFIELTVSRDSLNRFRGFNGRNPKVGQWFHIDMPGEDGMPVMQYTSLLDNDGTPRHMSSVDFLDGRTGIGRLLSQVISLDYFQDSDVDDIMNIFNNLMSAELIAVYNVGQGNCCALCSADGIPLTYFDFGGGMGQHAYTYPRSLKFCFTMNPPIILSHWDKDHWVSAMYNSESLNSKWIVPRQKLGVSHLKHAKNLFARNNLYIYPKTVPNIQLTIGMLIKDIGKSINDSGITLANEINVSRNNNFLTLFPGDCQYKFIPGINNFNINGLIAKHHGGHNVRDIPPVPHPSRNRIVYSYGEHNIFAHPRSEAVDNYMNTGWTHRLDTIDGHVLLGPMINGTPPPQPCASKDCGLQLVQN